MKNSNVFSRASRWSSRAAGHPLAFLFAVGIILVWLALGPIFHFSDTWQLVVNTGTTVITFLMVFLIQHSQNKDTAAIQVKLDELIRSMHGAHNALLDLEELEDHELEQIRANYRKLARDARQLVTRGGIDTESPDI
ncbi:hypothetical protein LBMAG48_14410 [Phycisphaerae bacterium]|jgi:low affinity Fe/Cu permease|nr:hypothetical protein LBMAG48_14410 [Phycisphaerae bacterium]